MTLRHQFSVLIAVYDRDDPVRFTEALDSIVANSVMPSQIVLVVDGPIGVDTEAVIRRFRRGDILEVVRSDVNQGLAKSLNLGLKRVKFEYVFRADADDVNDVFRFEKQLEMFNLGFDLLGGQIREFDEDGKQLKRRSVPLTDEEIKQFAKRRCPFNHMTVAFRTEVLKKVGGYPEGFFKEDYCLWALILSKGYKVGNLSDVLVHVTAGAGMQDRRGGIKYAFEEIKLQAYLVKLGISSFHEALLIGFSRMVVFLLPASIRGFIYNRFLRS